MRKKISNWIAKFFTNEPIQKSLTELSKNGTYPIKSIKKGKFLDISLIEDVLGYKIIRRLPSGTEIELLVDSTGQLTLNKIVRPSNSEKMVSSCLHRSNNNKPYWLRVDLTDGRKVNLLKQRDGWSHSNLSI